MSSNITNLTILKFMCAPWRQMTDGIYIKARVKYLPGAAIFCYDNQKMYKFQTLKAYETLKF